MSSLTALSKSKQDLLMQPEALLLQSNILYFPSAPIDGNVAQYVNTRLLAISQRNADPITLIINSSGGSVSDGLAIIDCMNSLENPIFTHVMGISASMGACVSTSGEPGHRTISPYARIMIHQPLVSGISGQASDVAIMAENLEYTKQVTNSMLAQNTGRTIEEIAAVTDRDHWFTAEEAVTFHLADKVLSNFSEANHE